MFNSSIESSPSKIALSLGFNSALFAANSALFKVSQPKTSAIYFIASRCMRPIALVPSLVASSIILTPIFRMPPEISIPLTGLSTLIGTVSLSTWGGMKIAKKCASPLAFRQVAALEVIFHLEKAFIEALIAPPKGPRNPNNSFDI